jgi:hypothetical protein
LASPKSPVAGSPRGSSAVRVLLQYLRPALGRCPIVAAAQLIFDTTFD